MSERIYQILKKRNFSSLGGYQFVNEENSISIYAK